MASHSFELEQVDAIAVGTVGQPGQRQFFLQARGGGQTVTLACEKFHIQGLITRIHQLLEAQGIEAEKDPGPTASVQEPLVADWAIAELGLGYHESRRLFVIVAREQGREQRGEQGQEPGQLGHAFGQEPGTEEESEPEAAEAATARLWAGPDQVRAFARQAGEVLAGGRATCQHCGLPIDPAGHPCPAANGSRPIF
jgi:uncharacterized repeat protein (TIGR03847 family)